MPPFLDGCCCRGPLWSTALICNSSGDHPAASISSIRSRPGRGATDSPYRMHSLPWSGFVCLAVAGVLGCGGPGDEAGKPGKPGKPYRTSDFSFVLPSGWVETPARSSELEGDVASGAAVAPEEAAPSSVVAVLAYDVGDLEDDTVEGRRTWFEFYADTNDSQVTRLPKEIALAGGAAFKGSLVWTDSVGNPVEVEFVRAMRGDVMYLIQCQAEPVDRVAIRAGCAAIVKSFRAKLRP